VCIYISSAGHDLNHPGKSNTFLSNQLHPLALTYNDSAILENMHAAELSKLINTGEQTDITHGWAKDEKKEFRKGLIDSIMGTDMANHFNE
jgi:hypothetical protein